MFHLLFRFSMRRVGPSRQHSSVRYAAKKKKNKFTTALWTGIASLLILTQSNDVCRCSSKLTYCPFVFVDKYSVLRGVAGEGEGERGQRINHNGI